MPLGSGCNGTHTFTECCGHTAHESTGEKPSFLLYGHGCRSPTEAALLPSSRLEPVDVEDYREEMVVALSEARELAVKSIRKAQQRYKKQYAFTAESG